MNKKKLLLWGACTSGSLALLLVVSVLMLLHVPTFYRRAEAPPSNMRRDLSQKFIGVAAQLLTDFKDGHGPWGETFLEGHINSFFQEDFTQKGNAGEETKEKISATDLQKQGVSDVRVALQKDKLRVGFRYTYGPWSAILSYDLKVWVAPREFNVLAIEILGRHIGAMPVSSDSLRDEISELCRHKGIEVTWFRHNANPVALIRLEPDRPRPTAQIRSISIQDGKLDIVGVSFDPTQQSATRLPPKMLELRGN